jgi:hypothetical protein
VDALREGSRAGLRKLASLPGVFGCEEVRYETMEVTVALM